MPRILAGKSSINIFVKKASHWICALLTQEFRRVGASRLLQQDNLPPNNSGLCHPGKRCGDSTLDGNERIILTCVWNCNHREAIQRAQAVVERAFTEKRSRTRLTTNWSTAEQAFCPWRTVVPTQTARSSSSLSHQQPGWTVCTPFSDAFTKVSSTRKPCSQSDCLAKLLSLCSEVHRSFVLTCVGMNIVKRISMVEVGEHDKPVDDVRILRAYPNSDATLPWWEPHENGGANSNCCCARTVPDALLTTSTRFCSFAPPNGFENKPMDSVPLLTSRWKALWNFQLVSSLRFLRGDIEIAIREWRKSNDLLAWSNQ